MKASIYKYTTLAHRDKGFTLVELLVTVAIIGILASIAIPQFAAYREYAYDSATISDVKGLIIGQEAYFLDNETYAGCAGATACESKLPGFHASPQTVVWTTAQPNLESQFFNAFGCSVKGSRADAGLTLFPGEERGVSLFGFSGQNNSHRGIYKIGGGGTVDECTR